METNFNKTVLIAPLDWGLGHATRCISVIKAFKQLNWKIIVAADGASKALLQDEFSDIQFETLKGYNIQYPKNEKWFSLKILLQIPKICRAICFEKKWVNNFLKQNAVDLIISDNRYGFYSHKAPSVFITHQLLIKAPFSIIEKFLQKINYHFINHFTECWVADMQADNGIAGELSHPKKFPRIPAKYMGILARFEKNKLEKKYDYCIILSGPEGQKIVFENLIRRDIYQLNKKVLLIRGRPDEKKEFESTDNVIIKNHLAGNELQQAIQQSEFVISRSGYTTVMEILSLRAKAILVATPHQTEQEYLSTVLLQKHWCYTVEQKNFKLKNVFVEAEKFDYRFPKTEAFNAEKLNTLLSGINL